MSLEDFKKDGARKGSYNNQHTKKDSYIDGGTVLRTKEGAIKACKKLHGLDAFEGWPTATQWNTHRKKVGLSTTANHIKRQTGLDFNEVKELAGDKNIHRPDVSEPDAYMHMLKAAIQYGDDFVKQDMAENNSLMSPSTVERITNQSFNECKNTLGLELNYERGIDKERIKEELKSVLDNNGYPITMNEVNSMCSFSHHTIERFGDGNYLQGINNLGFGTQASQIVNLKKDTLSSNATRMLNSINKYDSDAYGHIYVLELEHKCVTDTLIYVGQSINLNRRLQNHIQYGGDFNIPLDSDGGIVNSSDIMFNFDLVGVDNVYKKEYNDIDRALKYLEQVKQNKMCRVHNDKVVIGR